jgi:hypothetical protein
MTQHQAYSVVLTYFEDRQEITMQAVDRARLAPVLTGVLEIPVLLDEHNFKLDDEFARRLGVAILNGIALGQPDIKQYMTVTQHPIDRPPSNPA